MVVEAPDGGFLVAGSRSTADEERNLWLIRTNADGGLQWPADIGSTQNDEVHALALRTDGSCVIAGFNDNDILVVCQRMNVG